MSQSVFPHEVRKTYGDLLRNIVLAKDISLDHAGLLCLCEITHALWQNGIAIVSPTIYSKETDEALGVC